MARSWLIAFTLIIVSAAPTGADHERQALQFFTTVVFPKGLAYHGTYVSGECIANVHVGIMSVERIDCTFSAQ
jgi:hypothetical protein